MNAIAAQAPAKDDDLDCKTMSATPTDWAIVGGKGRWLVKGNGSYGGHVCDGYFGTEFEIKTRIPRNVAGDPGLGMK